MKKVSRSMVQWVLAVTLLSVSLMSFALPTPKDIDLAVHNGQWVQAQAMLEEVIRSKPDSARAHYELAEVLALQSQPVKALTEIERARSLDPSLKFASSPAGFEQKFQRILQLAEAERAPRTQAPAVQSTPTAGGSTGFPMSYVWIGIGALVVLAFIIRQRARPSAPAAAWPNTASSVPPSGMATGYGYPSAPAAPSGSSGVTGAVIGGVAGLAAGYALAKTLEGDRPTGSGHAVPQDSGYVPMDAPAQPGLGGFDSGSGDGWDASDNDAGSSTDDSW